MHFKKPYFQKPHLTILGKYLFVKNSECQSEGRKNIHTKFDFRLPQNYLKR